METAGENTSTGIVRFQAANVADRQWTEEGPEPARGWAARWAAIELASTTDYITGQSALALAAPNMGDKSCWYTECRTPTGARMETAELGTRTAGCAATRATLGTDLIVDAREALKIAGHPKGNDSRAVPSANHVRAILEMAWQQTFQEAIEGADERVEVVLCTRSLRRRTSERERRQIAQIGESMSILWGQSYAALVWDRWLRTIWRG